MSKNPENCPHAKFIGFTNYGKHWQPVYRCKRHKNLPANTTLCMNCFEFERRWKRGTWRGCLGNQSVDVPSLSPTTTAKIPQRKRCGFQLLVLRIQAREVSQILR